MVALALSMHPLSLACSLALSFFLISSLEEVTCYVLKQPCGEAHVVGTEAANNRASEHRSSSHPAFLAGPSYEKAALSDTLIAISWETLNQRNSATLCPDS